MKKGALAPFFYTINTMKKYLLILFCLFIYSGLQAQTLKVMSYNIHVGQDVTNKDQLQQMADFIRSSKADLVGLQEVDSVCNRSGKIDQAKFLAEKTGMYYAYTSHFPFDGGSYGIAILSRYPLSDVKDHRIILTSDGKSAAATRALLSVSVLSGKKKLTFATVHMDYRDSNSRLAQSEELVKLFSGRAEPVILTGDFNSNPDTKEVANLKKIFTDTGSDSAISFPAIKPVKKIDYVLVSKQNLAKAIKQVVYPVLYSDHLPVMSTVKIKR
jgi:endonuclease/exonuclease/phosphatase family metal-dependent hydrolase